MRRHEDTSHYDSRRMSSNAVTEGGKKKRARSGNDADGKVQSSGETTQQQLWSYYVNAGSDTRPCEKPYESNKGVELNFNYWIQQKYINDANVNSMVLDLLDNQTPKYFRQSRHCEVPSHAKSVVLVVVHGIDPMELGKRLEELAFLCSCSSMPIHHVAQLDDHNSTLVSDKKWQYMEAENMSSLLLWPGRSALDLSTLCGMSAKAVFSSCSAVFNAQYADWVDELTLVKDGSVTERSVRQLLAAKLLQVDGVSDKVKACYTTLHDAFPAAEGRVLGRMNRARNGEAGLFVFDEAQSRLYLLWRRFDVEVLEDSTGEASYTIDAKLPTGTQAGGVKLVDGVATVQAPADRVLSFSKRIDRSSPYRTEKYLHLELVQAVALSRAAEPATTMEELETMIDQPPVDQTSSVEPLSGAGAGDGESVVVAASVEPAHEYQSILDELRESHAYIARHSGDRERVPYPLEELLLRGDMQAALGYPQSAEREVATDGSFFTDTESEQWAAAVAADMAQLRAASAIAAAGAETRESELEEGEERDEGGHWEDAGDSDRQTVESDVPSASDNSARVSGDNSSSSSSSGSVSSEVAQSATSVSSAPGASVVAKESGNSRHRRFGATEEGEEAEAGEVTVETGSAAVTVASAPYIIRLPASPLPLCAVDCEMCSTEAGLELTRITVLCPERGIVYDTLVKPQRPITDYNTEFSGITEEALRGVTTTMADVHVALRRMVDRHTVLVGHSLDSDLKVLHVVHRRVVDTSVLYPHPRGLPFKVSLKNLAKDVLRKDIQGSAGGHDSVQDAAISLQLAFLKATLGDKVGVLAPWADSAVPRYSLFEQLTERLMDRTGCNSVARDLYINVHSNRARADRRPWERHALGYRADGDSEAVAGAFLASYQMGDGQDKLRMQCFRRTNNADTAKDVVERLAELRVNHSEADTLRSLVWVDMVLGAEAKAEERAQSTSAEEAAGDSEMPHKRTRLNEQSDYVDSADMAAAAVDCEWAALDGQLAAMFSAAPSGAHLLVLTQGDLSTVKVVASQKLRNRWEYASFKKRLHLADCGRTPWDTVLDDKRHQVASAHAIAGTVFVARKMDQC